MQTRHLTASALTLAAALITGSTATVAHAEEITYYFGAAQKHTNIAFVSKTAVEEIVGSTTSASGWVKVDWDAGIATKGLRLSGLPTRRRRITIANTDSNRQISAK